MIFIDKLIMHLQLKYIIKKLKFLPDAHCIFIKSLKYIANYLTLYNYNYYINRNLYNNKCKNYYKNYYIFIIIN